MATKKVDYDIPKRLRKRAKQANDALLAAIAEYWGHDSPLLDLFRDKAQCELYAENLINGTVKLPDVELSPEQKQLFGIHDAE